MLPTILIGITIFLGMMSIGIILRKYCNRRGSLTTLNNIIYYMTVIELAYAWLKTD